LNDHVEIEAAQSLQILGGVHHAHVHGDAKPRQVALERQDHALEIGLHEEHLKDERLAVLDQLAALYVPPGLPQEIGATRRFSRMLPLPSVTGWEISFVVTSEGRPSGSSKAFSCAEGRPEEAMSELEKKLVERAYWP
jgi:hypothetical protein